MAVGVSAPGEVEPAVVGRPTAPTSTPSPTTLVWWFGLAAAGCRVAVSAVGVVRANPAWLATHVQDDGYYYLEIAQRVVRGEGTTLDGINPTNGFHPLWQGVLSFLALFFHR